MALRNSAMRDLVNIFSPTYNSLYISLSLFNNQDMGVGTEGRGPLGFRGRLNGAIFRQGFFRCLLPKNFFADALESTLSIRKDLV